jgi:hypothetical protein
LGQTVTLGTKWLVVLWLFRGGANGLGCGAEIFTLIIFENFLENSLEFWRKFFSQEESSPHAGYQDGYLIDNLPTSP